MPGGLRRTPHRTAAGLGDSPPRGGTGILPVLPVPGSRKASVSFFACIGTLNPCRFVVEQPSRLFLRASRPRRVLGRDVRRQAGRPPHYLPVQGARMAEKRKVHGRNLFFFKK